MKRKIWIQAVLSMILVAALTVTAFAQREPDYQGQIDRKAERDRTIEQLVEGVLDYEKITYQSREGRMDIPAYVFAPLEKRGREAHPALIWVHGGVHGDFTPNYITFIKEACARGYVVICPEYRGSTGYGKEHYLAIDYGGYEVDDCISAMDYLERRDMSYVDTDRVAMIGWSHGGFITLHALERFQGMFKCGVAIVPVTNLVFRLAYKGPGYQSYYTSQERIGGNTWERRREYIERSPVYHVDNIEEPVLVHVARNDRDVNFVECEMMIHALEYHIPHLAETKIYDDPRGGHSFNRQVDRETWERDDTPEQLDSWNRIWTFLEWNLRPYEWDDRK